MQMWVGVGVVACACGQSANVTFNTHTHTVLSPHKSAALCSTDSFVRISPARHRIVLSAGQGERTHSIPTTRPEPERRPILDRSIFRFRVRYFLCVLVYACEHARARACARPARLAFSSVKFTLNHAHIGGRRRRHRRLG